MAGLPGGVGVAGPPGDKGSIGPQGPQGPKGLKGPLGDICKCPFLMTAQVLSCLENLVLYLSIHCKSFSLLAALFPPSTEFEYFM